MKSNRLSVVQPATQKRMQILYMCSQNGRDSLVDRRLMLGCSLFILLECVHVRVHVYMYVAIYCIIHSMYVYILLLYV